MIRQTINVKVFQITKKQASKKPIEKQGESDFLAAMEMQICTLSL